MPENGNYLFTSIGFSSHEEPFLLVQKNEKFISFDPIGHSLTLRFDTSQRYCTGWKDISTGQRFSCPTRQVIAEKFEQCSVCQKRTGFNPAFYHASSVSPQQEARNAEPHILYLAHFAPTIIKVGISHAQRGAARLLEQGARSALVLDTFPTAHIARQYEAKIATLPHIVESIQMRKKLAFMHHDYDAPGASNELYDTKKLIESQLTVSFASNHVQLLDNYYFPTGKLTVADMISSDSQHMISGSVVGLLGSVLFCRSTDKLLYVPLKKYAGYHVHISDTTTQVPTVAVQTTLF